MGALLLSWLRLVLRGRVCSPQLSRLVWTIASVVASAYIATHVDLALRNIDESRYYCIGSHSQRQVLKFY